MSQKPTCSPCKRETRSSSAGHTKFKIKPFKKNHIWMKNASWPDQKEGSSIKQHLPTSIKCFDSFLPFSENFDCLLQLENQAEHIQKAVVQRHRGNSRDVWFSHIHNHSTFFQQLRNQRNVPVPKERKLTSALRRLRWRDNLQARQNKQRKTTNISIP